MKTYLLTTITGPKSGRQCYVRTDPTLPVAFVLSTAAAKRFELAFVETEFKLNVNGRGTFFGSGFDRQGEKVEFTVIPVDEDANTESHPLVIRVRTRHALKFCLLSGSGNLLNRKAYAALFFNRHRAENTAQQIRDASPDAVIKIGRL